MDKNISDLLTKGEVGVIPTDTIYGIVGSALNQETVERIYQLRKRAADKPFIILIPSIEDLKKFGIQLTEKQKEFLEKVWPNPVSVILPVKNEKFNYLHRGKNSLAFRMPKNEWLLDILKRVGPLVAPSANIEGQKPSETIDNAKQYFGDNVDFYMDGDRIESQPSTLIQLTSYGSYNILRQGTFQL
ncbi:threonylcarbamoyl-AMP synthase [Candidatus Daviesbacteria bacterium]|nr:threonylcarbamoyl-AMP synthase [Candidatus Daviesbacteria bacterium]